MVNAVFLDLYSDYTRVNIKPNYLHILGSERGSGGLRAGQVGDGGH